MKLNITTSLLGIIILLAVSVSIQTCRVNKAIKAKGVAENDRASAIEFANNAEQKTEMYSNAYNNQIARTKVVEMSLENVKALRNNERLKFLNQFEGLKKDLKNLEEFIKTEININEDSIPSKIVYVTCKDSIKIFQYSLVDEFNNIHALVIDTPQFDIRVPIYSTVYWRRKRKFMWWRLGPKQWFIESFSPNKLVEIDKQELIKVTRKN